MTVLDRLIPAAQLMEINAADVPAPPSIVWDRIRHGELAQAPLVRALFALRNLFMRDSSGASPTIRIDDLRSSPERPGFQMLVNDPPREFAVGAIGQVWRLDIPFVHVATANDYARFGQPGYVKVAWAVRVVPGETNDRCRVEIDVRVHATDEPSWRKFQRYFWLVGPFSRYIRRSFLKALVRDAARPDGRPAAPAHHPAGGR